MDDVWRMMYDVWCMMDDGWWMMYDIWCMMYDDVMWDVWVRWNDVCCEMYDVMWDTSKSLPNRREICRKEQTITIAWQWFASLLIAVIIIQRHTYTFIHAVAHICRYQRWIFTSHIHSSHITSHSDTLNTYIYTHNNQHTTQHSYAIHTHHHSTTSPVVSALASRSPDAHVECVCTHVQTAKQS